MLKKLHAGYWFINGFISFYLTALIAQMTLSTKLQEICVFLYFMVMLGIGNYFWARKYNGRKMKNSYYLLAGILSITATIVFAEKSLPEKYERNVINITILEDKNKESQGREVWLSGVLVNGKSQNLNDVVHTSEISKPWRLNGENLIGNAEENETAIIVELPKAKRIELSFGMHAWSGMVQIQAGDNLWTYDLYSESGDQFIAEIPPVKHAYSQVENIIFLIGILGIYMYFTVALIQYFTSRKK